MVRSPAGSTSRARCRASEVARSALAGVTAKMMALSPCEHNSLVSVFCVGCQEAQRAAAAAP